MVAFWIVVATFAIAALAMAHSLYKNGALLQKVESFDIEELRCDLAERLHRLFDDSALIWKPGLDRDGITIFTTHTQQDLGAAVRTYRVTSWLDVRAISVDQMVALLDGGFLREEVWHKKDFQGGACLREIERSSNRSDWIAQYISAMKPFRQREFVYLLSRREVRPGMFSQQWHPEGDPIARQVVIRYQSVRFDMGSTKMVRAIQYSSLDRITQYASGKIRWEHIMAFHIAGVFPLWLNNLMTKPAMEVLFNEAANMRKHAGARRIGDAVGD